MTTEPVEWEPIEPDQLQIGHFIKIDHRWFDHPFVRRSFQLSSERELATIREVKLTRVFVDRKQSAVSGGLQPTAQQEEAAPPPEAPAATPEVDAAPVDEAAKARAEAAAAVQAESEAAA